MPHFSELRALKHSLSPERAQWLDTVTQQWREPMRARIGELIRARRAVQSALVAEPFEVETLAQAFAQLRAAEAAAAVDVHAMLQAVLEHGTVDERRRLAELMRLRSPRHDRQRRREASADVSPSHDTADERQPTDRGD
jgi:uncharacterized membrane protein